MNSLPSKIKNPYFVDLRKVIFRGCSIKPCAVIGAFLIASGGFSAQATVLANGDFTANAASFNASSGYLGGGNSSEISGWLTYPDNQGKGLNGALTGMGNVFGPANDGGYTYAFVQGAGNGIYQYIALQPNTTYTLEIAVAGRSGDLSPKFSVQLAKPGEIATPFWDSRGLNGGGPSPASQSVFTHYSLPFTTPADLTGSPTSATIQLWNRSQGGGDNTVVFANVSISVMRAETLSILAPPNMGAR